jgi:hypothetical protein
MSYENTICPCGGKKKPDTMLCPECLAFFKRRDELRVYTDPREPRHYRAQAARILCALAKKRKAVPA